MNTKVNRLFTAMLIVIMLLIVLDANSQSDYSFKKTYNKRGVEVYYIYNFTGNWLYCEFHGENYYYNEFEVEPYKRSRQYRIPSESFSGGCK